MLSLERMDTCFDLIFSVWEQEAGVRLQPGRDLRQRRHRHKQLLYRYPHLAVEPWLLRNRHLHLLHIHPRGEPRRRRHLLNIHPDSCITIWCYIFIPGANHWGGGCFAITISWLLLLPNSKVLPPKSCHCLEENLGVFGDDVLHLHRVDPSRYLVPHVALLRHDLLLVLRSLLHLDSKQWWPRGRVATAGRRPSPTGSSRRTPGMCASPSVSGGYSTRPASRPCSLAPRWPLSA